MREKIITTFYIILAAAVIIIAIVKLFLANGPPPDQISQIRQQIKSEQMIQVTRGGGV